jgi:hypothetical protein
MVGLSDLFGKNGWLEQLVVWGLLNQALGALSDPALTALKQDVDAAHPLLVLSPPTLADAAVRGMTTVKAAQAEAAKSGIDAARFATMLDLATVRIPAADLAEAVLRSYLSVGQAEGEAARQGYTAAQFATLVDLAGDGIAPTDAVRALIRGLIPKSGAGAGSVSYEQAIAESRLHNKWGPVLERLADQLLSPADLADAVVRNFESASRAAAIAGRQGVSSADFETLVHLAGDAPAPGQLAEALRRGLIHDAGTGASSTSFEQGIAEGRLANKWTDVIKGLAKLWPSPVDALDAQVKGQLTDAQAHELYAKLGGDPQFEPWLYNSIGEGPTPLEAAVLAARGIIPWEGEGPGVTSYHQAVRESHYRNKWTDAYRKLAEHIPPPSTITTQLAHQIITREVATAELLQNDMTEAQAAAYVAEAEYEAVSDYRGLTQAAVVDMYFAHLLDHDQAVAVLGDLHVTPQAAELLLAYADVRYVVDSVNKTVARLQTLFAARKIGVESARAALLKLKIPAATVTATLADWELQAAITVKTLTEAQVVDAWYYNVLSDAEAIQLLGAIGYTPFDAWTVLSIKAKGPLPGKPVNTAVAPVAAVIPGTT